MKKCVCLLLSLWLALSPLAHSDQELAGIKAIDQFVRSVENTEFDFLLQLEMLNQLTKKEAGASELVKNLIERINLAQSGPQPSIERLNWSERAAELEAKAQQVAVEIFKQNLSDVNLTLLALLHRYLFDTSAKAATHILLKAVLNYRFSPEELYRLRKEASWAHQYSNGSLVALGVATVAALIGGRKTFSAETWLTIKNALKRSLGGSKPESKVNVIAQEVSQNELDQILKQIEKENEIFNLGKPSTTAIKEGPRPMPGETLGRLGRARIFESISRNLLSPTGFKGLLWITGLSAAGGFSNIGLYQLAQELSPESLENGTLRFDLLLSEDYQGLSVLRLSCQSHALLERVNKLKQSELLETFKRLNQIYADFELLKAAAPQFLDVVALSTHVRLDAALGEVKFSRFSRGHTIEESFECLKLKDKNFSAGPLSTSLNEVLVDVTKTLQLLTPQAEGAK